MPLRSLVRALPNLLVFMALAGVAVWGHRTGWKVPKFAALRGEPAGGKADWCEAHNVPESQCVECDESLLPRPPEFGWCPTHGVHECPLCHPQVAQLERPYQVSDEDRERAERALLRERPANSRTCQLHRRRIQFASAADAERAGLDVDVVSRSRVQEAASVYGEIVHDPALVARLAPRAAGSLAVVFKHLGDRVKPGDLLALVDAADVGKAKAEFHQAIVQTEARRKARDLARSLVKIGTAEPAALTAAEAAFLEAKVRFIAARQALVNYGLMNTPDDARALSEEGAKDAGEAELADRLRFLGIAEAARADFSRVTPSDNLLPLRAPAGGKVVSPDTVAGTIVDPSRPLFEIVDASQVWLLLDVRAEDAGKIVPGTTRVIFRPDGVPHDVGGTISWVGGEADARTRTVKARAVLANTAGELRANTFGTGRIVLREEPEAVVVPNAAMHWEGDCHVVFVRDRDWLKEDSFKVFHTRVVRPGARGDRVTEIIAGVLPGEVVATRGSEILRAELLRANLGEG
jgi:cobalt-zinc-cadmium efflux system membrane fusion protein